MVWCQCVCFGKSESSRLWMDGGVLFQDVFWRWVGFLGGGWGVSWRCFFFWGVGGGGTGVRSLSHRFFIMSTLVWYHVGRGGDYIPSLTTPPPPFKFR